ncbi:MAG: lytic transglycosylase domain-containing protein [Desulfobacteraceae bacterium]
MKSLIYTCCFLWMFSFFVGPAPAAGEAQAYPILKAHIIAYNLEAYDRLVSHEDYRGQAGILMMGPELAEALGLKTWMDQDYVKGKDRHAEADRLFHEAVAAMTTQQPQTAPGGHAAKVAELALAYNTALEAARNHMRAYRLRLTPQRDDRLNRDICSNLMETLLTEAFQGVSFNLREGLGAFYNRCQGLPESCPPLTPENIRFVNHVFRAFVREAPDAVKARYDLGRQVLDDRANPGKTWKTVVEARARPFLQYLDPLIAKWKQGRYPVDPLLFLALMKRESNLDPRAVSYVGAVGLTQIMPQTGKGLGMEQIYMPPYFEQALAMLKKERKLRHRARAILRHITRPGMTEEGRRARAMMQESLRYGEKRSNLLARYRKDVLSRNQDDRLKPELSIRYGYAYFSQMMKMHDGDISLALAAYNAGPHRVKQYQGIPPYSETVSFRNTVMAYYKVYLNQLH